MELIAGLAFQIWFDCGFVFDDERFDRDLLWTDEVYVSFCLLYVLVFWERSFEYLVVGNIVDLVC